MLIAIIGNSAESMLNFRASLIRRLVDSGCRVIAFAPDYCSQTRDAVAELGAKPYDFFLDRSGMNPLADIKTLISLCASIAKLKPHGTLCYFIKPAIYGTLAAFFCRVRQRVVMLEGLGYGFADKGHSLKHRAMATTLKGLLRVALMKATKTLVLNDDDRTILTQVVSIPSDRVINIGGIGVELGDFEPAPVREQVTTFAMAARLIVEKGVYQYIEAARIIRQLRDDVQFLLLGGIDDNPNALAASEVQTWNDEGIVCWPGRVDDVQAWLRQADVFVLPSFYREGVPRSIQEAMALGRPIITTDHVGCRDTVEAGVNGLLIPIRDVPALVSAMRYFLDNPGVAQNMGRESRLLAEQRFDAVNADNLIIRMLGVAAPPIEVCEAVNAAAPAGC